MTTRNSTRVLAALAALGTAVVLSACNSPQPASDGHTDHSHAEDSQAPVISGEPAAFNSEDVNFASMMVPHHEQALELSALVPDRSTNPELIQLAQTIEAAQEPEIATMKAFLVQWNENSDPAAGHGGHDMSSMQGMVDAATMTKLESLQGPEFDKLWLESMIAHHEGAIVMAEAELANGANVDAKQLAHHIVDGQQAEIDQMKAMLGGGQ
ncbi:MAG: DUF305 domain-containing protein [Mycobacterium sp.]